MCRGGSWLFKRVLTRNKYLNAPASKQTVLRAFATDAGTTAETGKLRLTFCLPHQVIAKDSVVDQINLSSTEGDLGILGGHVPAILQLRPGLVELFTNGTSASTTATKQSYFISGGFATINPDSTMQIAAMEAFPIEQLDAQLVSQELGEAQKQMAAAGSMTEEERAALQIQLDVYQAMSYAISKGTK